MDREIDYLLARNMLMILLTEKTIPCGCGKYRGIVRCKITDALLTRCDVCGAQSRFNMADLAILSCALLRYASDDMNNRHLEPPYITHEDARKIIGEHEAWREEMKAAAEKIIDDSLDALKSGFFDSLKKIH